MEFDDAIVAALGSNLTGGRESSVAVLEAALARFDAMGLKVLSLSSFWRSASWPDPAKPDYINAVALVETRLSAAEALAALHRIEDEFGRQRDEPNAPRVLDLDLIAYGRQVSAAPALPHPRAADRLFVMGPLAEIAPGWRHPVLGKTAVELAKGATVGADATPLP